MSNEHPDMSGNPCDEPFLCNQCERILEDSVFGCFTDEEAMFCSQTCADEYDEESLDQFIGKWEKELEDL